MPSGFTYEGGGGRLSLALVLRVQVDARVRA